MILEAGCKVKQWKYDKSGNAIHYEIIASGQLLERGVCIGKNYRKYIAPHGRDTQVRTSIEYQRVREVDAKKQTVSIDILLTMMWQDPNIKTNSISDSDNDDEIILRPEKVSNIWIPDLYVWNRTSIETKDEWAFMKTAKILLSTKNIDEDDPDSQTTVELKYEIKTTIYCEFEYSKYPMDIQNCSVRFGSGSDATIFILYDKDHSYHTSKQYMADGLNVKITFFGEENHLRKKPVGFHIVMNRLLRPFLMKYYIPSILIVAVSDIGFLIPLTAIPGRIALLVTQFLTLVNLFIYQLVSHVLA